ncbi:hypothetical protein [Botrimarina mediterranea]|uniref:Uncharacterized protein n=1 Tax=Botrimarina mediterranea TaxID=2528022 RepID=A0A518KCI9_9BACT|nr:hypothetical protein [Botrimarina mediterranea]QDV75511.1 hypothetical protein Spa11_37290 [Botrimarina mediterranea]QDV80144.1 hypothetical protein K2D_37680 [Planctomycetes bacterium K2D]
MMSLSAALAAAAPPQADLPAVSEADRAVAEGWASQVDDDLKSNDPAEAARLLLRVVRWDPSRWDDYRSAIDLLESVDPEAAARHAVAELRGRARFVGADAALLSRLAKAADESDDDATWQDAAELTRAAAELTAKLGPEQALQAAQLWADAGSAYASRGDLSAASGAYDLMQRVVAATEGEELKQAYRWDLIAGFHLDAAQPTRAGSAIELMRDREGETPRVLVLQSRLALALDEPLVAIDHAERAIGKLSGAADEAAEGAYSVYVDAMHTINQSDRAADQLAKDATAAPDNVALALAVIDARVDAGQLEPAWNACGALIEELSAGLSPVEGHLSAYSSADPVQLDRFADAATRRLRLATRMGRVREVLSDSVEWTERLGSLDLVWDELAALCREDGFGSEASQWLDEHRADPEAPAAENLAPATIAYLIGRPEEVAVYILALLEQAWEQDVQAGAIADECASWADYLLNDRHDAAARALLEAAIDRLEGKPNATVTAGLRTRLARAIINQQVKAGQIDDAVADEAQRILTAARGQSPDNGLIAYRVVFDLLYMGRTAEAIAVCEQVFKRWPAPDKESLFGSQRFHQASELFAAALLQRNEPGDADRAAELLEASLDAWPQSATAMTYLAWHDSRSPDRLGRALRLVGDAVRTRPGAGESRGYLGVVQLRAGRVEKGIESLRQAIAMSDEQRLSLWERDFFRNELAEALRANGRAEEAEVVESATAPAN